MYAFFVILSKKPQVGTQTSQVECLSGNDDDIDRSSKEVDEHSESASSASDVSEGEVSDGAWETLSSDSDVLSIPEKLVRLYTQNVITLPNY